MQKQAHYKDGTSSLQANGIPFLKDAVHGPEGALIAGEAEDNGKIAVVYNRGENPPEITIKQTAGQVQTVLADGVAVAIVACADGPSLTRDDVLLVERFVAGRA